MRLRVSALNIEARCYFNFLIKLCFNENINMHFKYFHIYWLVDLCLQCLYIRAVIELQFLNFPSKHSQINPPKKI